MEFIMTVPFTHLHVHTQYSLLDGASMPKELLQRAMELGMDSIAVTDHGNMYGAVDMYQT
ncbi:MAG: PHP domain-containing protein, partial [Acidaminococcaceae bacterium]|nr:PHP domain-containing protein [Acidaminococcaceae bacterium]